jgi:hypothetical protein
VEDIKSEVQTDTAAVSPLPVGPTDPAVAIDTPAKPVDPLDELADLDFLLEDIEDKIAPLALHSLVAA